jgi:hypothetical protein
VLYPLSYEGGACRKVGENCLGRSIPPSPRVILAGDEGGCPLSWQENGWLPNPRMPLERALLPAVKRRPGSQWISAASAVL